MDNKAKRKRGVIKFVKDDIDYSMNGVAELSVVKTKPTVVVTHYGDAHMT